MKTCHECGGIVKGNTSSAETTAFKCSHCCNGEVEHVRNNPDKFPNMNPQKKPVVNLRKDKSKLPKGTTLATC